MSDAGTLLPLYLEVAGWHPDLILMAQHAAHPLPNSDPMFGCRWSDRAYWYHGMLKAPYRYSAFGGEKLLISIMRSIPQPSCVATEDMLQSMVLRADVVGWNFDTALEVSLTATLGNELTGRHNVGYAQPYPSALIHEIDEWYALRLARDFLRRCMIPAARVDDMILGDNLREEGGER